MKSMKDEYSIMSANMGARIVAQLGGESLRIQRLRLDEQRSLNERIMDEKVQWRYLDALREPSLSFEQWRPPTGRMGDAPSIDAYLPEREVDETVYVVTDTSGFYRAHRSLVSELLSLPSFSHEVYVVALDMAWLIGIYHARLVLQGLAAEGKSAGG
jgi:hypothetical protein